MRILRLPILARSASMIAIALSGGIPATALAQAQSGPQPGDAPAAPSPTTDADQNGAPAPVAQESDAAGSGPQDIVVTGIRASLERSINIKRNSFGVVDAISAEDIGKFPDTNLAESLQRITGVSIDRVNNEGAQVTVRGFGPSFNLVTLNGRTLASSYAQTVGGDQSADGTRGVTRSFDFSNLASEGVRTLEVYKTGRAAVPSGGIGATINVITRRPLDGTKPGLSGSIGAKLNWDTSTSDCLDCGSPVNPQFNGFVNWSNPEQTFGVALFGSYQERNFSTVSATSNDWNIRTLSDFLDPGNGFVNAQTKINNLPGDPNTLVSVPNDSRYHFAEDRYQRINGQAVMQFKPTDTLTLTADALYAQTKEREQRSDESNWFNRPFNVVTFDNGGAVATTTFLQENIAGVKDGDYEQQYRAQKNTLEDYGLNAKWEVADNFTLSFDGHIGYSSVRPDAPNGTSSTLVGIAANVISAHSVDYSGSIPVQDITVNDAIAGNGNGVIDVGDLGSQVGRTYTTAQSQKVKEGRIDGDWDLGGGSKFDFGGLYRTSTTRQTLLSTQQTLGDWGVTHPGDVEQLAPGVVEQFCLLCKFHAYDPKATGQNLIAFRGDPIALYSALSNYYAQAGNAVGVTANENNAVKEEIWAGYGQVMWEGEIAGHKANLVAGVRYEHTDVHANSLQAQPTAIVWNSDNDFTVQVSSTQSPITAFGSYDNILPAMDFSFQFKPNMIGRLSFSRTIARPDYNYLFAATSVAVPPRPTAIGGVATASAGNPNLKPLMSDNIDLSFEYYYKRDSFISIGFFDKRVHNFIGTGQHTDTLFGLRDPSSGAAGTLSGQARTALQGLSADISDVNLFTMSALIQQTGSVANGTQQFQQHYNTQTRALDQAFINSVLASVDITAGPNDPLFQFSVSQPINNRDAEIYGFEIAGQHFFGDTGIGVAASFTYVKGDVAFDNGADPNTDQFALTGLSNTANATLIYDKHGISARLAYNWRDKFLSQLNRDSYRNPAYTKPYGQLDLNISYDITPRIALSLEGINLTNSTLRTYGRDETNLWFAQEFQRRFLFGARYRF